MASLTKRADSPYYIACFTTADGRQLKRSTSIRFAPTPGDVMTAPQAKREAMRLANDFELAARTTRTATQTREVIASLHERITGDLLPQRNTRDAMMSWLDRKRPEVTPSTITYYQHSVAKFLAFIGPVADQDLTRLTRQHITGYRNHLASKLSAASVNHDVCVVKQFTKDCRREGLLIENPAEFVDKLKNRHRVNSARRAFTLPEISAVLAKASPEWRSMVLFGIYTGQRLGDLLNLTWRNIDLTSNMIRFTSAKTQRRMHIPIAEPLRFHIDRLERVTEFVHPTLSVQGNTTACGQFADILAAAGLRVKKRHRAHHGKGRDAGKTLNPLSFHSLRHTAVTMLKEAGVPAAIVMEIVGHDSVAISQLYTHIGEDVLAAAMAKMPAITTSPSLALPSPLSPPPLPPLLPLA